MRKKRRLIELILVISLAVVCYPCFYLVVGAAASLLSRGGNALWGGLGLAVVVSLALIADFLFFFWCYRSMRKALEKEAEEARQDLQELWHREEEKGLEIVRVTKVMEDADKEMSLEKAGKILEEAGIWFEVQTPTAAKINLPDVFWSVSSSRLKAVSLMTACRYGLAFLLDESCDGLCLMTLGRMLLERLPVDPSGTLEVVLNLDRNREVRNLRQYLGELL